MPKPNEDLIGRCFIDPRDRHATLMEVTGVTLLLTTPGVWVKPFYVPDDSGERPFWLSSTPYWRNAARVRELIETYERQHP